MTNLHDEVLNLGYLTMLCQSYTLKVYDKSARRGIEVGLFDDYVSVIHFKALMTKLHDEILHLGYLATLYHSYTLNIDDKTARRGIEFRLFDDAMSVIHFKH
jgi:hypothetical protein